MYMVMVVIFTDNWQIKMPGLSQGLGQKRKAKTFEKIEGINNVVKIATGSFHSLLLTLDEKIYAFGLNNRGQLGLGDNLNRHSPTLVMDLQKL